MYLNKEKFLGLVWQFLSSVLLLCLMILVNIVQFWVLKEAWNRLLTSKERKLC